MNAYTVISACMEFYDYNATSSDNSSLRTKLLAREQEVFDEAWMEFGDEADFTQATTTVTLAQGASSVDLPTDFMSFGPNGGVFLRRSSTDRVPLTRITPRDLFEMLEENGTTTAEPGWFTVVGWSGSDFVPKLYVDVLADAAYTISVYYTKKPPTLSDTNSDASGLQTFPAEYHRSVIYKGTLARFAKDTGNSGQAQAFEAEYRAALAAAKSKRSMTAVEDERIGLGGYAQWRMW